MLQSVKNLIKKLPIALTRNQQYDRQTRQVLAKVLMPAGNCIDVGCHKGEVLELMRTFAPQGRHLGFEPIPDLYADLAERYKDTFCTIHNIALSNAKGTTSFNYVISNPAYSGLQKRKYDNPHEQDTLITVQTDLLDNILPPDFPVHLIKIDVEGGELLVLEGAKKTLLRHQPVVIFEHGIGASDYYDATPEAVYNLLHTCGLRVNTMKRYLAQQPAFSGVEFVQEYEQRLNYYFIAYP